MCPPLQHVSQLGHHSDRIGHRACGGLGHLRAAGTLFAYMAQSLCARQCAMPRTMFSGSLKHLLCAGRWQLRSVGAGEQ